MLPKPLFVSLSVTLYCMCTRDMCIHTCVAGILYNNVSSCKFYSLVCVCVCVYVVAVDVGTSSDSEDELYTTPQSTERTTGEEGMREGEGEGGREGEGGMDNPLYNANSDDEFEAQSLDGKSRTITNNELRDKHVLSHRARGDGRPTLMADTLSVSERRRATSLGEEGGGVESRRRCRSQPHEHESGTGERSGESLSEVEADVSSSVMQPVQHCSIPVKTHIGI